MSSKRIIGTIIIGLGCLLLLPTGCGKTEDINLPIPVPKEAESNKKREEKKECFIYEGKAAGSEVYEGNGTSIDASEKEKGYIMVKQDKTEGRVKLQIICSDMTYNYDLENNGEYKVFPIQMGSGLYTVRTIENIGGSAYSVIYSADIEINTENELTPYLYSNNIVNFGKKTEAVKKAAELCSGCENEKEKTEAVFEFITKNIKYDYDKADNIEKGYISDADTTLKTKKGICIDYAVLMAVMLRTQNIPTKVIYGSAREAQWHSWNMVYYDGQWRLFDATFAAGGVTGEDYIESYSY